MRMRAWACLIILVLGMRSVGFVREQGLSALGVGLSAACLLGAAGLVTWLLRRKARRYGLIAALAGAAVVVSLALWVHEDLRGERQDQGPEPARVDSVPRFAAAPPLREGYSHLPEVADGRLRLVVWGDCRNSIEVQDRLVAEIRRRQPELSVGLGDFVGMSRTYQFRLLGRRLDRSETFTLLVPGNHDLDPFGTLKPYSQVFSAPNWVFPQWGVLLLGLNTAHGVADPVDVTWLEQQVEKHRAGAKHILLFCHHPVFAPLNRPKKALPDDASTARLRALVEREGIAVFSANFHGYDVQRHGRALQVVTGGAGSRPESDAPYHCVAVEVGDEIRVEQVVLAQHHEISENAERLLVLRDEGLYAVAEFGLHVSGIAVGLAMFLGGLVGAAWRRRSPHSSSASSA